MRPSAVAFAVVMAAMATLPACSDSPGPVVASDSAPVVSGLIAAWDNSGVTLPSAAVFVAGDTIHLIVDAVDNRRVRWIGLSITDPVAFSDSAEVTDSLAGVRLTAHIITSPNFASLLRINGFARDDRGQRTEAELRGNPASVFLNADRQTVSAQLDARVRDVAFDTKRDRAYLSLADSGRIAVMSLSTGNLGAPLVPPVPPAGIDLSADGDSLVVALPSLGALGVLDLTSASPTWHTIPLAFDTSWGRHPDNLRVSAANVVLVSITATGATGAVGQVVAYHLSTGAQSVRTDVSYWEGYPGIVTDATPMTRSADGSRVLLLFDNACCPENAQVYVSQSDAFLTRRPTIQWYGPPMSSDGTGKWFLVGPTLFDNTLAHPLEYYPPSNGAASALSQSGDTAYFSNGPGFFRTRLADGATLERVALPWAPSRLYSIPGSAERVFAMIPTTVVVVTLGVTAHSAASREAPRMRLHLSPRTP